MTFVSDCEPWRAAGLVGKLIYLRRFAHAAAPVNICYFQVVFKLRDLSRSIQLVKLYNIARSQLLGRSERRF